MVKPFHGAVCFLRALPPRRFQQRRGSALVGLSGQRHGISERFHLKVQPWLSIPYNSTLVCLLARDMQVTSQGHPMLDGGAEVRVRGLENELEGLEIRTRGLF